MRQPLNFLTAAVTAAAIVAVSAAGAFAECKRYGFSVNDYGKDGPTKDAKDLLDKLIATQMAEKGVKDYKTGTKTVSCELFLNFIVFDEHTCTAEATVCWGGSSLPSSEQAAASGEPAVTKTSTSDATKPTKKKKKNEEAAKSPASDAGKSAAKQSSSAASSTTTAAAKLAEDPKDVVPKLEAKQEADQPPASSPEPTASTPSDATAAAATPPTGESNKADTPAPTTASAAPQPPATEATTAPSPIVPPATTASVTPPSSTSPEAAKSSKPVETGSLVESGKKPAKHKAEKAASGNDDGNPKMPKKAESGYPTPQPPQPGE